MLDNGVHEATSLGVGMGGSPAMVGAVLGGIVLEVWAIMVLALSCGRDKLEGE
jgi:hypothetical protein